MDTIKEWSECKIDFSTIPQYSSFIEWMDKDVSRAFYTGYFMEKVKEGLSDFSSNSSSFVDELYDVFDNSLKYKSELIKYLSEAAENDPNFNILEVTNTILNNLNFENPDDKYGVSFTIGSVLGKLVDDYVDYLKSDE